MPNLYSSRPGNFPSFWSTELGCDTTEWSKEIASITQQNRQFRYRLPKTLNDELNAPDARLSSAGAVTTSNRHILQQLCQPSTCNSEQIKTKGKLLLQINDSHQAIA